MISCKQEDSVITVINLLIVCQSVHSLAQTLSCYTLLDFWFRTLVKGIFCLGFIMPQLW